MKNPSRYSISDSPAHLAMLNNASSVMPTGNHTKNQSLLSPGGALHINRGNTDGVSKQDNLMMRQHNDSLNSSFDSRKPQYQNGVTVNEYGN